MHGGRNANVSHVCRSPGPSVPFGAAGAGGCAGAPEEGRGAVNEPSPCRLAGCEVPSPAHLLLSAAVILFAVLASVVWNSVV